MEAPAGIFSKTRAGFMGLPLELRQQIYDYLLRPGDRLVIEDLLLANLDNSPEGVPSRTVYTFRQPSPRLRIESSSAMATYSRYHGAERRRYGHRLQVYTKVLWLNRQIRDEALPFLYGQHLHFACSPDGVDAFLKDQPDDVLGSIRHVTLVIPSETGRMKFMSLCSFMARALRLKILGVRVNTFLWGVNPFEKLLERKGDIRLFLTLDWVQSLLAIRDLDSLNIAFNDRYMMKMVDMSAELTKSLQARMLTRNVYNRAELEDWLRTEKHGAVVGR